MDEAAVAELFQVFVANVISRFGMLSAYDVPYTFLGVQINDVEAGRSIDDREKPVAPGQFVVLRPLKKFTVKNSDKRRSGLLAFDPVSQPPAQEACRFTAHFAF